MRVGEVYNARAQVVDSFRHDIGKGGMGGLGVLKSYLKNVPQMVPSNHAKTSKNIYFLRRFLHNLRYDLRYNKSYLESYQKTL
jgi:hypothetical protein